MALHPFVHNRMLGLADHTGRVHAAPIYERLEPLSGGRRAFYRERKYGFLDEHGQTAIPATFSWTQSFVAGWGVASSTGGIYGLLDPDGNWGLEPNFAALGPVSETLTLAKAIGGSDWGLLEIATGKWRIQPAWKDVFKGDGRMAVKLGSKYGGIDLDGKVLVPKGWSSLRPNADGTWMGQATKKDPFQRLGPTGEILQTYADGLAVLPFLGPYAAAQEGKLWGLIDVDGNWVLDPVSTSWLHVQSTEPIRVQVNKAYGYALPNQGITIPAQYALATDFIDGHAVADLQVIDRTGQVVAKIDPTQPPLVVPPPAAAKGRAAKALVARFGGRRASAIDPVVVARIAGLPDPDIAAVLHAWYASGMPWISLGEWDLWTTTYGVRLEEALRAGKSVLPLGHGAYNDPINLRFLRGSPEIRIDSNPDDTRPRAFSSLQAFADTMVVDALFKLEDDNEAWPLPDWLVTWFRAGGLSDHTKTALEEHVRRVVGRGGANGEQAAAWLAEHGTPAPDTSAVSMAFGPCDAAAAYPIAPADVDAALNAGGHAHYIQGSRWVSVTNKGIRFADDKGKRQVAALRAFAAAGPAVVVLEDVALVTSKTEALRVSLATGKKEKLFERPYGEVDLLSPTPDGTAVLGVLRGEQYVTNSVRVYDLGGETQRDIPTPAIKFAKEAIPLWGSLVAVWHLDGVVVIDVAANAVVALHQGSVREARKVGDRFTISLYGDKHLALI